MHFAIGDIHGCFRTLEALLEQVSFDRTRDRIWLLGDLVNRGPASLEVLRWAYEHDDCVDAVLGNHDLHLLARRLGVRDPHPLDTLEPVLAAPDADVLVDWLRNRPLVLEAPGVFMVHAGLHPSWDLEQARRVARSVESVLRGSDESRLVSAYARDRDQGWSELADEFSQLVAALRVFTTMRRCTPGGERCPDPARPDEPEECRPWYQQRALSPALTIVTGHWARLGYHREPGLLALDSGCVWGGSLTAARIDSGHAPDPGSTWQQACRDETGLSPAD